jgi:hypothetical protein
MGYRSNVVVALRNSVEIPKNISAILNSIFGDPHVSDVGTLFYVEQVKWYDFDDAHDCHTLTTYLTDLDYEDFFFARVGDDTGDVEERGSWRDGFEIYIDTVLKFDAPVALSSDIYTLSQPVQKVLYKSEKHLRGILSHCVEAARLAKGKKSPDLKVVESIRAVADELNRIADAVSEVKS